MSNAFRNDQPDPPPLPNLLAHSHPPLPNFLARRVLRSDEDVTWVRGPSYTPAWEGYVTHPSLFLVALLVATILIVSARSAVGSWEEVHPVVVFGGVGLVLASIFVLAFFNGYFTRLIVTTQRIFIMQGFEIRKSWTLDRLPRSFIRYTRRADGREERSIDLNSVSNILGGGSTQFTDAKTIRAFGKQLEQIRRQETERD